MWRNRFHRNSDRCGCGFISFSNDCCCSSLETSEEGKSSSHLHKTTKTPKGRRRRSRTQQSFDNTREGNL
ncbi:hypothetical protein ILYODFUR_038496 [Ilyodon furcidens]|uniref:Uncharacterized protein n=1 Tax=Ilyodon furcidens TaxID=33524 RepID=A0ABV0TEM1_9TELE